MLKVPQITIELDVFSLVFNCGAWDYLAVAVNLLAWAYLPYLETDIIDSLPYFLRRKPNFLLSF